MTTIEEPSIRDLAAEANRWADLINKYDVSILQFLCELADTKAEIERAERPYLLTAYDGRTADIRDAQRDEDMAADGELEELRNELRQREESLGGLRIARDDAERRFKIVLAELRRGVER